MVIAINRCVVISPKKEITDVYHNKVLDLSVNRTRDGCLQWSRVGKLACVIRRCMMSHGCVSNKKLVGMVIYMNNLYADIMLTNGYAN